MDTRFYNQKSLITAIVNTLGGKQGVAYNGMTYRYLGYEEDSQLSNGDVGHYNIYSTDFITHESKQGLYKYEIVLKFQLYVDDNYGDLSNNSTADEVDFHWLIQKIRLPGINEITLSDISYRDTSQDSDSQKVAEFTAKFQTLRIYQ